MPLNTSIDLWSRIISNMNIQALSLDDDFTQLKKPVTEPSPHKNEVSATTQPGKSPLHNMSNKQPT